MREIEILEAAIVARARALAEHGEPQPLNVAMAEQADPAARTFLEGRSVTQSDQAPLVTEDDVPAAARPIVIGHHYVLLGELDSDPEPKAVRAQLRRYHNRLALDRSFLGPAAEDLLLILVGPGGSADDETWQERRAAVERDAFVCRKLVWLPPEDDAPADAEAFLSRTFLARPWRAAAGATEGDADLDRMARIAERITAEGLSPDEAARWVDILSAPADDTDILESLVDALEPQP